MARSRRRRPLATISRVLLVLWLFLTVSACVDALEAPAESFANVLARVSASLSRGDREVNTSLDARTYVWDFNATQLPSLSITHSEGAVLSAGDGLESVSVLCVNGNSTGADSSLSPSISVTAGGFLRLHGLTFVGCASRASALIFVGAGGRLEADALGVSGDDCDALLIVDVVGDLVLRNASLTCTPKARSSLRDTPAVVLRAYGNATLSIVGSSFSEISLVEATDSATCAISNSTFANCSSSSARCMHARGHARISADGVRASVVDVPFGIVEDFAAFVMSGASVLRADRSVPAALVASGSGQLNASDFSLYLDNGEGILATDSAVVRAARGSVEALSGRTMSRAMSFNDASDASMEDVVFSGAITELDGGMLSVTSSARLTATRLVFDGVLAQGMGGCVAVAGSSVARLYDMSVRGVSGRLEGGCLYASDSALVDVMGGSIEGVSTSKNGGVLSARANSRVTLAHVNFSDCTAAGEGGVVYAADASTVSLTNCVLRRANATDGGAFSLSREAVVSVEQSVVGETRAFGSGGFALVMDSARLTVNASSLNDCAASRQGGVVAVVGNGNVVFDGAAIANARAGERGGAFSASDSSSLRLLACNVTESAAHSDGGFVYANGAVVSVLGGQIDDVVSEEGNGGFVFAGSAAKVFLRGVSVVGARASGKSGGAFFLTEFASVNVTASSFSSLRCRVSGCVAVVLASASLHMDNVVVDGAFSGGGAAGVLARGAHAVVAMNHTRMRSVRREGRSGIGDGWLSGLDEAFVLGAGVSCSNCTEAAYVPHAFDFASDVTSLVNVSRVVVTERVPFSDLLARAATGEAIALSQPLTVVGAEEDAETTLALASVQFERGSLSFAADAILSSCTLSDMRSVTVRDGGRAAFHRCDFARTPVTVSGFAHFVDVTFDSSSQLTADTYATLLCERCAFGASRVHRDIKRAAAVGTVPFIVLSQGAYATFRDAVVGPALSSVALVENSAVLDVDGATATDVSSSGNGGLVSAASSGATNLPRVALKDVVIANANAQNGGVLALAGHGRATVTNCHIFSASASVSGAVFCLWDAASLAVDTLTLQRADSRLGGGLIAANGAVFATLANVTVGSVTSATNGGLVSMAVGPDGVASPVLDATSLHVQRCEANATGGCFYSTGGSLAVRDSTFSSGYALVAGGMINTGGQTSTAAWFSRCAFDDFESGFMGGLVATNDNSTIALVSCNATRLRSVVYGGTVFMSGGAVSFADARVSDTHVSRGIGGGLFVIAGVVEATNTVFSDAVADLGSGFASIQAFSYASFTNVSVHNVTTNSVGAGAIGVGGAAEITANGLFITQVSAEGDGGAFAFQGGAQGTLSNLRVSRSTARLGAGGALFVSGRCSLHVSDSNFENVTADDGGAVWVEGQVVATFRRTSITLARADKGHGGAFGCVGRATATLEDVNVLNGTALARGGVLYVADVAHATVSGLEARAPHAAEGGAVFVGGDGADATLVNARIYGSQADGNGGCIAVVSATVNVTGGLYSGCRSGLVGRTDGRGDFMYADTRAVVRAVRNTRVEASPLSNGPIVFSVDGLNTSTFAFGGVVGTTGAVVASPPSFLRVMVMDTAISLASLDVSVQPGETLPSFSLIVYDAYGQLALVPPSRPLALRLALGAPNNGCEIAGDLSRTFLVGSSVAFTGVRVSSSSVPLACRVIFGPDNRLYDDSQSLFDSASLTVLVSKCPVGTTLTRDAVKGVHGCAGAATTGGSSNADTIAAVVVPVVVVSIAVCVAALFVMRRNRAKWNRKQIEDFERHVHKAMPGVLSLDVPRDAIELGAEVGEGAFGQVYRAQVTLENRIRECAAKALKANASAEERIEFFSEAERMLPLKHPNVIRIVGISMADEPMLILLEFASHGSLRSFLVKRQSAAATKARDYDVVFARFSREIAEGMAYLASCGIVHKDLAARNVLVCVSAKGDACCKVSDFGLSRELGSKGYYRKSKRGQVPIKWTAPESLIRMVWTEKSDCWSFGVVMWEIWTFGQAPYPSVPNTEVVRYICSGKRLEVPVGCPTSVGALMHACWYSDPNERPSFASIVVSLQSIMEELTARDAPVGATNASEEFVDDDVCGVSDRVVASAPYDNPQPQASSEISLPRDVRMAGAGTGTGETFSDGSTRYVDPTPSPRSSLAANFSGGSEWRPRVYSQSTGGQFGVGRTREIVAGDMTSPSKSRRTTYISLVNSGFVPGARGRAESAAGESVELGTLSLDMPCESSDGVPHTFV